MATSHTDRRVTQIDAIGVTSNLFGITLRKYGITIHADYSELPKLIADLQAAQQKDPAVVETAPLSAASAVQRNG